MKTRSNKGLIVDFGAMMQHHGATIAVGNAHMNARGDILTHGGLIEQTAEQVSDDYYRDNPHAVTQSVPLSSIEDELLSPSELLNKMEANNTLPQAPKSRRRTTEE